MKTIIIGAGPAGYICGLRLKSLGADVTIIENNDTGGTCLNRGCIPSKAILEIAHRKHNFEEILNFTDLKELSLNFSWDKIKENKNKIVSSIRNSVEQLLKIKRINIIKGEASFINENTIKVLKKDLTTEEYNFDFAIIATGTKPFYPPPFDKFKNNLTDSDKIFDLEKFPNKLTIVGAGVIGIEMACFFNAMGSDVEIVELLPEILPFEDPQIVKVLKDSMEKRGIKFHLGVKTKNLFFENDKKIIELENSTIIKSDEIMIGTGRKCDFLKLNLENAKVEYSKFIKIDEFMKTTNPKIYAIGDINGLSMLAHSAEKQGEIVSENIFGEKKTFDTSIVPSCIYSWPEIASIGMSKKEAQNKNISIKLKKAYYQTNSRAMVSLNTEGFCQIIINEEETILGAQIVGQNATEIIHTLALAVKFKMKIKDLKSMIFAHPTISEIIKEAINK